MTLAEFVQQKFEPHVIARRTRAGQKHYRYVLSKHVLPEIGTLEVSALAPDHVEELIARKQTAGYSRQTLHHIKYAISAMVRHAQHLRIYDDYRNPARGVELPPADPLKRPTFTSDQLRLVLGRLDSPVREMALLSVACSLGPAELCGLRIRHANLTASVRESEGEILAPWSLAIRESYYERQRGKLKTGQRKRNVPITPGLAARLAAVIERAKSRDGEAPLFQSRNVTPLDPHNIAARTFKPLAERLGFAITWYAFRRAHSSQASLTGADLGDRKLVMGHADDRMTRYYDVPDVERMRAVPARILAHLGADCL